jgi:hypothetical protein
MLPRQVALLPQSPTLLVVRSATQGRRGLGEDWIVAYSASAHGSALTWSTYWAAA